jgi:hypothetical protein
MVKGPLKFDADLSRHGSSVARYCLRQNRKSFPDPVPFQVDGPTHKHGFQYREQPHQFGEAHMRRHFAGLEQQCP